MSRARRQIASALASAAAIGPLFETPVSIGDNDCRARSSERGLALVVVLLTTALLSGIGLSLLLTLSMEPRAAANQQDALATQYAAEAGLELAAFELARKPDWSAVLGGSAFSSYRDGPPSGMRRLGPNRAIELAAITNRLTCGRSTPCSDAARKAVLAARPWGANNPSWRLYAYGPLTAFQLLPLSGEAYIVVWVADDTMESDDEPEVDGGMGANDPGRHVLRVRAEAFSSRGSHRGVEALLVRKCRVDEAGEHCQPGARTPAWRALHDTATLSGALH